MTERIGGGGGVYGAGMADEPDFGPVATAFAVLLMVPFTFGSIAVGVRIFDAHGLVWSVLWFAVLEWPVALIVVGVPSILVAIVENRLRA